MKPATTPLRRVLLHPRGLLVLLVLGLLGMLPRTSAAQSDACTVTEGCFSVTLADVTPNEDGSLTYTWTVTVNCEQGLSHVSFELPEGVTPSYDDPYVGDLATWSTIELTTNPFYSIKFERASDENIKNGDTERFEYTLPAGSSLPNPIRIEVKVGGGGQDSATGTTVELDTDACLNCGSISGVVFEDTDGDGVQDAGEPGIPSAIVSISGPESAQATTDADGAFSFTGLPPGTYTVDPDGNSVSPRVLTTGNDPLTVQLSLCEEFTEADFGYWCPPDLLWEEDFDGNALQPGQIIDDEFAAYGIHISTDTDHGAMIYDSSCPGGCSGGDPDLGSPHQSFGGPGEGAGGASGQPGENKFAHDNILIVSEDGDSNDPDDKGNGGTIIFTFDTPFFIGGVTLLDIENGSTTVTAYDEVSGGSVVAAVTAANLGDNSAQEVLLSAGNVRRLEVHFSESGALLGVFFCGEVVLPVELTSFDAQLDGDRALLRWETASETNNAGFEIQHFAPERGTFEPVGFVEGHGTTAQPQRYTYQLEDLSPGVHRFRLKQIDFDGAFEYSPEVELYVEMPETFVVEPVYPNPFNPQATLRFGVRQAQHVRVELFNLLGQRVRTLFEGELEAGEMHTLTIDGSTLQSGTYLVRIVGERFTTGQKITLVK